MLELWKLHWLSHNSSLNETNSSTIHSSAVYEECKGLRAPTAEVLIHNLPANGLVLLGILSCITLVTVLIYIEEIYFLFHNFPITLRRKKTIWVLAFYPMFSVCGLLACFIPRCGTLVDLIANLFFATCLYNLGRLLVNYLGGTKRAWELVGGHGRSVDFRVLPVCCCCVCLPTKPLTNRLYTCINVLIMQVAIVRPMAHFVAAVFWTNDSYVQGEMKLNKVSFYITIINIISTMLAVYGLMLLRKLFLPELEKQFKIAGKIASIQLCLIASIIPNLVLNGLLANDRIPCTKLISTKSMAGAILHMSWILMMLPFALMARFFFRRIEDASGFAKNLNSYENGVTELKSVQNDLNEK